MTSKNEINKEKEKSEEREIATKNARKDMLLDIAPYIIIIVFVVLLRTFIATPVSVHGTSMDPTLKDGDTMILYKLTKKFRGIKRKDIVVIKTDSGKLIKRIIGLPGDVITYKIEEKDGKTFNTLYVNGKVIKEDYITKENQAKTCVSQTGEIWTLCETEIKVPKGEYYVLGDNRGNSKDSRMIGTVKEEDISGTTELVIFPFTRFGIKD